MRTRWLAWVPVLACAVAPAMAQDFQHEVFGGFSALSHGVAVVGSPAQTTVNLMTGWQGSYAFNVNENLGVVADFGGHYKSFRTHHHMGTFSNQGFRIKQRSHELLFGPRFNARTGAVTGFVHYLAGVVNGKSEASDLDNPGPNPFLFNTAGTNFAHAVGGGLDLPATDSVTIRVIQVDVLMERVGEVQTDEGGGTTGVDPAYWQNDVRVAFGLVFGL